MITNDTVKSIHNISDFLNFIKLLEKDFAVNNEQWENVTIDQYFNAIHACIEDNLYHGSVFENESEIKWSEMAQVFWMGKYYE